MLLLLNLHLPPHQAAAKLHKSPPQYANKCGSSLIAIHNIFEVCYSPPLRYFKLLEAKETAQTEAQAKLVNALVEQVHRVGNRQDIYANAATQRLSTGVRPEPRVRPHTWIQHVHDP